ncbi:MAG TPA: pyruvate formate lyase family protein [Symbiobacteriaceae bacterium]|jgi:formate C-acetyltransferase
MSTTFDLTRLSPRLQTMRRRAIQAPQEISLVRARAITDAVFNHPELPRSLQFALALQETFRHLPIQIADDERIVGALTEKVKGAVLYPELKSDFLSKELDNFREREHDQFVISEAEKAELHGSILPPWDGTSAFDEMLSRQSEETQFAMRNLLFVVNNDFSGSNHLTYLDYGRVLKGGFRAAIRQAEAAMALIAPSESDAAEKQTFYQSVIWSAEAVIAWADRYAQAALALAESASTDRGRALREIAAIAAKVPAEPAETFREAVQSFWFTFLALMQTDGAEEIPLGRLDQFLYPYYARDLAAGRLTEPEALELLEELFVKCNQLTYLNEYAAMRVMDGNTQRLTLTVGGMDGAGNDVTNELSLLILEAVDSLRLTRPNVAVRLHPGTGETFRRRALQLMTGGANLIEVFNDPVVIRGFTGQGFPLAAARGYMVTGCVQPIPADTYGPTCSAFLNGPKALELLLNGGAPFLSPSGEEQDRPAPQFDSYEALWAAFKGQLTSTVRSLTEALAVVGDVQRRLLPNPLLSALVDGPLTSGRDVKAGGARSNLTGVDLLGLGTLADSLAAIKEMVFAKGTYPLPQLVEWLKADFEGYEPQRQMLLNRAPKFGNDDRRVDQIAAEVVDWLATVLSEYHTYRGGVFALGLHSETHHVIQGLMVAATPDGRRAQEMLSPGCGPVSGMDRGGPTAALRSLAAVDFAQATGGVSANMRFNPTLLGTPEQVDQFGAMLAAYFALGGQHLQISVVDTATLRAAQRNPEQYQDLIVRVTGYSARFVDLSPGTQEEIIRRSEMAVCG